MRTRWAAQAKTWRRYSMSNKAESAPPAGWASRSSSHLGPSGSEAGGLPAAGGQEVDDQVAGDPREPGSERAPGRVGVPLLDRAGDRAENLLCEVVRVGLLTRLARARRWISGS